MKTALLHYWLTNMRGGENVLAEFCKLYPDADIYTHACNPAKMPETITAHPIRESFIARLPGARNGCQKYLPLMPRALQGWNFDDYDLILSSESGPVKGIRKPKRCRHVCYCHTPMRYLWDMYADYYRHSSLPAKLAMSLCKHYLRHYDLKSADSVDAFIANSKFVAERIRRIYHRESTVIYPPVDTTFFAGGNYQKKEYYLFVGQLIAYKQPQLALAACRKLKRPLVVVGDGELRSALSAEFGDTAQFAGRAADEQLRRLYAEARALIFPGVEDFGIVPLEAQAAGTPVIALGRGGALETVIAGRTGLFFAEPTVESLIGALLEFETATFNQAELQQNAKRFNAERFRQEIRQFIDQLQPTK